MDDQPITVLLIEDDADDARRIREMLADAGDVGFQTERVDRMSRAVARLNRGAVDAILLDLSLPDSDGLDTFAKAYAQAPGVPIIVLADRADDKLAIRAVREGAQDYLPKHQIDARTFRLRAVRDE